MTTTPEQAVTDPTVAADDLVADAADAIREQIDQWLDRVVDRILAAPAPGTAAWQQAWRDRATPTGRAAERQRLLGCGQGKPKSRPELISSRESGAEALSGR